VSVLAKSDGLQDWTEAAIGTSYVVRRGEKNTLTFAARTHWEKASGVEKDSAVGQFHKLRTLNAPLIVMMVAPVVMVLDFRMIENFA